MLDARTHVSMWLKGGRRLTTMLRVKDRREELICDEFLPKVLVGSERLSLLSMLVSTFRFNTWIGAQRNIRSSLGLNDWVLNLRLIAFTTVPGAVSVTSLLIQLLVDCNYNAPFSIHCSIVCCSSILVGLVSF